MSISLRCDLHAHGVTVILAILLETIKGVIKPFPGFSTITDVLGLVKMEIFNLLKLIFDKVEVVAYLSFDFGTI